MLLQFQKWSTCKFMLGHWFLLYAIIFFIHLSYRIIHYHFMIFITNTIWTFEGLTNQHNLNLILPLWLVLRWTWKLYSFAYWSWKRSHRLVTASIGNLRAENQLSFSYRPNEHHLTVKLITTDCFWFNYHLTVVLHCYFKKLIKLALPSNS